MTLLAMEKCDPSSAFFGFMASPPSHSRAGFPFADGVVLGCVDAPLAQ